MRVMIHCARKKGDTADIRKALEALGVKIENEVMISKDSCVLIADVPDDVLARARAIPGISQIFSNPRIDPFGA